MSIHARKRGTATARKFWGLGLKELVRECFVHGPLDQVGSGRVCLNGHFTSHKSNVYTCMWVSDTTSAQRWLSGWVGMAK